MKPTERWCVDCGALMSIEQYPPPKRSHHAPRCRRCGETFNRERKDRKEIAGWAARLKEHRRNRDADLN